MFGDYLALAAGGVAGTFLRYWVYLLGRHFFGSSFPVGTLVVNLVGSFGIAFLAAWLLSFFEDNVLWRLLLLVGFFGSFTTFSTFSLDNLVLLKEGRILVALAYISASAIGGILLAFLGWQLGSKITDAGPL